jgi:hypothetical protein
MVHFGPPGWSRAICWFARFVKFLRPEKYDLAGQQIGPALRPKASVNTHVRVEI